MKNIDRLSRNIEKYNWNNATLKDLTAFTDLEELTPIHELLEKLVKFLLDGNKNPHFRNITDFLKWCNEPAFTMKTEIYDSLEAFQRGFYDYICKTKDSIFIQSGENRALVDNQIINICLMGFNYDDFGFLELNKIYKINDLLEKANIEECGN